MSRPTSAKKAATLPAHTLYEIVRKLPEGAQISWTRPRRRPADAEIGRSRFAAGHCRKSDFRTFGGRIHVVHPSRRATCAS